MMPFIIQIREFKMYTAFFQHQKYSICSLFLLSFLMLIRIVRMNFHKEQVPSFLALFQNSKSVIKSFPGCTYLELLQDASDACVFYTYSHWSDEKALESYRDSTFFKGTWAKTKVLFASKAQAFSLKEIDT